MAQTVRSGPAIYCVYQPIVTIDGQAVVGYEALARAPGRDLRCMLQAMDPTEARAFDAGMVARAVQGAFGLPEGVRLFVNVTVETLRGVLAGDPWPLPPRLSPGSPPVVWEIPEGRAGSAALLQRGAAGVLDAVEVALDDLGEGDSDLRRLAAYPGAWAKLGLSLVRDCDRDRAKAAVIRAVVAMAAELGQRVIAEGVEREGEAVALGAMGIRYAQGFHFGVPARWGADGAGVGDIATAEAEWSQTSRWRQRG